MRPGFLIPCAAAALLMLGTTPVRADTPADLELPTPRTAGGMSLRDALSARASSRSFAARALPAQVLSDLLWAAAGINRPDSGRRTAPSAMNWQEIDVYAVLETGAYRYDAGANVLRGVAAGDLRAATGAQDFVGGAPLNLVYVADERKMTRGSPEDRVLYAAADAGFIGQNVYLFCAAEGLATVVRGSVDREALARALGLAPEQRVVLAQTVGYPGP